MALYADTRIEIERLHAVQVIDNLVYHSGSLQPFIKPFENSDFEAGSLKNWTPEGEAFTTQPTFLDNIANRAHFGGAFPVGKYWIGTFENRPNLLSKPGQVQLDPPTGTLKSTPFILEKRFLSGLVGGGKQINCAVSIEAEGKEIARFTGVDDERLSPFIADVTEYLGKEARIVIYDLESGFWSHVNADDFCMFGE